jgi:hypothetical protein
MKLAVISTNSPLRASGNLSSSRGSSANIRITVPSSCALSSFAFASRSKKIVICRTAIIQRSITGDPYFFNGWGVHVASYTLVLHRSEGDCM